ncbi:ATP-binding protein [Clostridium sartagoforme]|uniref:ATP-binding protein n=1 Tax=Clostridium sartagoforme TaxID=84031 RepID=A0A4S2DGP4_9CLOT|nr:ATP-binding protein [Clostridium sartagoforme]TGY40121.1 ATP-binding protein [Clostridium sartagoforme]
MSSLELINMKVKSFIVFNKIFEDKVMKSFINMIDVKESSTIEKVEKYSSFVRELFEKNESFSEYIWQLIVFDENIYIRKLSNKEDVSEMLERCVKHELETLQEISRITSREIKDEIGCDIFLPEWTTSLDYDFKIMYQNRMENLFTLGYGIYANNIMFTYNNGGIVPAKYPDSIRLSSHIGYERQQKRIIDNTYAFLKDKPAANVLLYGDAGTGKSSTIKAIVNEFADIGLRMIEVRKGDLLKLPELIEKLANNPLKFIIFIDDLSFAKNNEEIGALKAILEGSVSGKTENVVLYATSNRRHLVQESFSDRDGDDIHRNETIQEQTSLSDRFGLAICFSKPDKKEYLDIIHGLVKEYKIKDIENLDILAERHAMERGGRSGRTARQFVEYLKSIQE